MPENIEEAELDEARDMNEEAEQNEEWEADEAGLDEARDRLNEEACSLIDDEAGVEEVLNRQIILDSKFQ
jgi:hypothetical protein